MDDCGDRDVHWSASTPSIDMSTVAVIPARGGSKSISRKNIKVLGGHPLIAYSVAAGLEARTVDRVLVSTDDVEIADVGRRYGAEVPFLRPAELARDETRDLPVFEHALEWLEEHGERPESLVQLRPTSPFRPPGLVDDVVEGLTEDHDSVRTITEAKKSPYKMWIRRGDRIVPLLDEDLGIEEPFNAPRQTLPKVFVHTGHVDVFWSQTISVHGSLAGPRVRGHRVPSAYCIDIDTMADWRRAEQLMDEGLDMVRPDSSE